MLHYISVQHAVRKISDETMSEVKNVNSKRTTTYYCLGLQHY